MGYILRGFKDNLKSSKNLGLSLRQGANSLKNEVRSEGLIGVIRELSDEIRYELSSERGQKLEDLVEEDSFKEVYRIFDRMGLEPLGTSGYAVSAYTGGKRPIEDLDLVLGDTEALHRLKNVLGGKIKRKRRRVGNLTFDNFQYRTTYKDIKIEATVGLTGEERGDLYDKLKRDKETIELNGVDIDLVPREQLILIKALLGREKDKRDLKLLKGLDYDLELIKKLKKAWGNHIDLFKILKEGGYEIRFD